MVILVFVLIVVCFFFEVVIILVKWCILMVLKVLFLLSVLNGVWLSVVRDMDFRDRLFLVRFLDIVFCIFCIKFVWFLCNWFIVI